MLMAHLYFKIPLIYLDFTPIASLCTKSIYQPSSFAYPWLYFVRFVIYPMSENIAEDWFYRPDKRNFVRNLFYILDFYFYF